MNLDLNYYANEIRHIISTASLNYDIWRTYKDQEVRSSHIKEMNRYSLFFRTSIQAHFASLIIAIYTLYETRDDTFNIPSLLKSLETEVNFPKSTLNFLQGTYNNEAKPLWIKISILRNKVFGHRYKSQKPEASFQQANVTPNEIRALIDISKNIINTTTHAVNKNRHSFNLSASSDTLRLLSDLKSLHEFKAIKNIDQKL